MAQLSGGDKKIKPRNAGHYFSVESAGRLSNRIKALVRKVYPLKHLTDKYLMNK